MARFSSEAAISTGAARFGYSSMNASSQSSSTWPMVSLSGLIVTIGRSGPG